MMFDNITNAYYVAKKLSLLYMMEDRFTDVHGVEHHYFQFLLLQFSMLPLLIVNLYFIKSVIIIE